MIKRYSSIADVFRQTVDKFSTHEALVYPRKQQRWTYREFDRQVNRMAHCLTASGVKRGDRVSVFLLNSSEFALAFFATAKLGAIFNPINFRLSSQELAYIVKDAEPKILLFEHALQGTVASVVEQCPGVSYLDADQSDVTWAQSLPTMITAAPETDPEVIVDETDVYGIMYTSGTTGRPKGVVHRHRDIVQQSLIMLAMQHLTDRDRGLVVAPLYHSGELHAPFLSRVQAGAANIILPQFVPSQVLDIIAKERITVMLAMPTMWNMLLQADLSQYDLRSLRLGLYGGSPMAPSMVRECNDRFGVELVSAYGMTEMGPSVTQLLPDEQIAKAGSAGRPLVEHEIRVARMGSRGLGEPEDLCEPGEIGEILVRGPCLMTEYYHLPEVTARAFYKDWYHSGDLGYLDSDGFLWISDRADDLIISGGENIFPREIEDVLFSHPGILDVAVVGEPNETWGERVVAYVVKRDPDLTADRLDTFLSESATLARFKRPRTYYFVQTLPRTATGKVQKFLLRQGSS